MTTAPEMPLPVVGAAPLAAGVAHDLELARRHAAGDLAAFEEVYRSHSALVFNLCRRLSGDPDEALDAAQEVFLRVHRHLGRFHGRSTLRTWIYRVAVNQCRRRFARRPPPALPLGVASACSGLRPGMTADPLPVFVSKSDSCSRAFTPVRDPL